MKKILPIAFILLAFLIPRAFAQDFSVPADTAFGVLGDLNVYDDITPNTTTEAIKWHVTATDFPADWLRHLSICDNNNCYNNAGGKMSPDDSSYTSKPYTAGVAGDFHMVVSGLNPDSISSGRHYCTVHLSSTSAFYSRDIVFVYSKGTTGVSPVTSAADDIVVYPNPCRSDINVTFNASSNIKNIAVFSIIGRALSVYRVAGNGANINLENLSSGIYFLRLYDSNGQVVATRKFTRQ